MRTRQKILRAVTLMTIPFVGSGIGYLIVGAGETFMWITAVILFVLLGYIGYRS
jgi:hypothetical protein